MKFPQNWCCMLLLAMLCLLAVTEARRKAKNACKYKKTKESDCDPATNVKTITQVLKKGDSTCAPTVTETKPCGAGVEKKRKSKKACKYEKSGAAWTECDESGYKKKTMKVKAGSSADCEPTQIKQKACGSNKKKKNPRKGCVYDKMPWSVCNGETKTKQREMILIKGDSTQCLPKKIVTKQCRRACRYQRDKWSPCDPVTRQKQRVLLPKSNSSLGCQPTVETQACHVRAELTAPKPNKCRYKMSPWSDCDPRSNTMSQVMTLKSGDPNVCQRSKKLSKKCKVACKFRRGEWSECDELTQLATRVDSLIKGSPSQCDSSRQITKKCRRLCKYTFGEWGECDPVTNHRTRVKKLVEGDKDKCPAEDMVTKPCGKKDGGERCFFGPWGEFGPCTNGVMTKNRPVKQGGVDCERKAVVTKACDRNS